MPFKEGTGTTTQDYSAYGNTGTLMPVGSEPAWTASGKYNNALVFDGSNDYVSIGNVSSLNFGTGSFTISIWIKASSTISGNVVVVQKADAVASNYAGFSVYLRPNDPYLRFHVSDGTHEQYTTSFATDLRDDLWHHIGIVWDSTTQKISMYLDGAFITNDTTGTATGSIDNAKPAEIGRNYQLGAGLQYFKGTIDEVRIYKRVLTLYEINAVMNNRRFIALEIQH